ncbi:MAG: hypothetical protein ACRCZ0_09025 [Cetobacterium sp.]
MTLLREEETMHILNNYQTFSHQDGAERRSALGALLDHFVRNNNDSDCIYIFNNLPPVLQKELDDMAGEISKQNVVMLEKLDELIKFNDKQIKSNEEQLTAVIERNKKHDEEIYQVECELERVRELNRQLGI